MATRTCRSPLSCWCRPEDTENTDQESPPEQPIHLVGGVNFTTWPDLKWSRGNSHVALLLSKFSEWHASARESVDAVLREDRLRIDLSARVPKGIPKHDWSLELGVALHNLRSELGHRARHAPDKGASRPGSAAHVRDLDRPRA